MSYLAKNYNRKKFPLSMEKVVIYIPLIKKVFRFCAGNSC